MPPESAAIPSPLESSIVEEFNVMTPFASTFRLDDPSITKPLPTATARPGCLRFRLRLKAVILLASSP
jgi:hypothetical protein